MEFELEYEKNEVSPGVFPRWIICLTTTVPASGLVGSNFAWQNTTFSVFYLLPWLCEDDGDSYSSMWASTSRQGALGSAGDDRVREGNLLLDPARFRLFVDVVNVRLPRLISTPPSSGLPVTFRIEVDLLRPT